MWAKTWLYSIKQRGRWYNKGWLHKEKAPTLTKNSRQENNHLALDWVRIRKLTPIECERLQNMKDNYTLVPRWKRMMSDSQRYKQCWNWRTVDVIAHILSFIK
jgi:site-specific DNA-cytosine methylase